MSFNAGFLEMTYDFEEWQGLLGHNRIFIEAAKESAYTYSFSI